MTNEKSNQPAEDEGDYWLGFRRNISIPGNRGLASALMVEPAVVQDGVDAEGLELSLPALGFETNMPVPFVDCWP